MTHQSEEKKLRKLLGKQQAVTHKKGSFYDQRDTKKKRAEKCQTTNTNLKIDTKKESKRGKYDNSESVNAILVLFEGFYQHFFMEMIVIDATRGDFCIYFCGVVLIYLG